MERRLFSLLGMAVLAANTSVSQAALIDLNNGLIYDDVLDISWLADTKLAATNTFGISGIEADGTMTWDLANVWIDALNANNYMGFNSWRMPSVTPVNGVSFDYTISYDGSTDKGFNNYNTSNELSHLFYSTLGNVGLCSTNNTAGTLSDFCEKNPPPWGLLNTGPFDNMDSGRYWTGTESTDNNLRAFDFGFGFGETGTGAKGGPKFVWAVLDGQAINPVPVPPAVWLFASGLAGMITFARRKN